MKPFEVGALRIEQLVARGGAGEVWRATHLQSGLPVAVKVLTGQKARNEGFRKSFTREMRALAGLDHPGIVRLFEHGEVTPAEEVVSEGRFVVGSPYLVMEFAGAGTLPQASIGSWAGLRDTLLALLDALAHAHAKGMVHRDIKPANLLLCAPDQARPGLKLSDFGIAHTIEWDSTVDSLEEMAGTLHFMAPEQATGAWRDYGPWTDLYSVGCVAWVLATGKLPYANKKGRQLLFAQLSEPPPAFVPAFPVPPDFEAWLRRMLCKDWSDRYLRAADAAWGLVRVERVHEPPPAPAYAEEPTHQAPKGAAARAGLELETLRFKPGEEPWRAPPAPGHTTARLHLPEGEVESHGDAPPIPRTWRRPEDERLAPPLFAAGLSLLPHRSPPLLGRQKERDALWTALRAVHRTHKPRVVIVEGGAGAGRTHLVRWLIERAHEVGAAERLALPWRADLTPPEVLRRSLSASLRAMRLSAERTEERLGELAAWLGPLDADTQRAAVRLLVEGGAAGLPTGERHRVAVELATRIAMRRPLIWWMDDADRCPEATELALRALEAEAPVLIVLGATGADWAPQPAHQARLKALLEHGRTSVVKLARLGPQEHLALCREHLRLAPTLAAELAAHTAGDPAFALRLVEDQLQRGQLRMGPEGIERSGVAPRPWPADLDGVWADRLSGALEGLPAAAARMLELAAALGDEVDEELWAEAADDPDGRHTLAMSGATPIAFSRSAAKLRNHTVERLLAAGLAVESGEGFAFADRRARAAAAAPAQAAGRWAAHHALCAAVLGRRKHRGQRELAERLGHHLLAAGRLDEAIEALLEGIRVRAASSGADDGLIGVDALERTLIAHHRTPPSEVHTRLQVLAASLHAELGNWEQAAESAESAVQTAHKHKWTALLRDALWQRAQVAIGQDHLAAAERDLRALRQAGGGFRDAQITGLAVYGLGVLAQRRGHGDAATALFEEALRYLDATIEPLRVAECKHHLGKVALRLGDHEGADARLREALAARELGNRPREAAESLIALAQLAALRGQHDLAAREWGRAAALLDGLRSAAANRPRLERAALDVLAGRAAEAEVRAGEARKALEHHDPERLLPFCHAVLLAVAAHKQSWRAFDLHLTRADRSGADCPADHLRPALLDWAAAQAHSDPTRAAAVARLAERWRALATA